MVLLFLRQCTLLAQNDPAFDRIKYSVLVSGLLA